MRLDPQSEDSRVQSEEIKSCHHAWVWLLVRLYLPSHLARLSAERDQAAKPQGQHTRARFGLPGTRVTLGFVWISSSCSFQPCTFQGNLSGRQEEQKGRVGGRRCCSEHQGLPQCGHHCVIQNWAHVLSPLTQAGETQFCQEAMGDFNRSLLSKSLKAFSLEASSLSLTAVCARLTASSMAGNDILVGSLLV